MDEGRARRRTGPAAELHDAEVEAAAGPIADGDSYFRQSYYPTGVARGWRRTGCLVMIVVFGVLTILPLLILASNR